MAGKLSRVAQHGCCLLAVGFWLPVAASALGDQEVRVSPGAKVIDNPFADPPRREPAAASQPPAPTTPPLPEAGPRMYQNPFAGQLPASLEVLPIGPGPISRWRQPTHRLCAAVPDDTVRVPADPIQRSARPLGLAPEVADAPAASANPFSSTGTSLSSAITAEPAVVMPESLVQPPWLLPDDGTELPAPLVGPMRHDPFDAADQVAAGAAHFVPPSRDAVRPRAPAAPGRLEDAFDVDVSEVGIDGRSSAEPQDWLASAQQAARTADTPAELSALVAYCRRGIAADVPPDERRSLRRLAAWALNRRGELAAGTQQPADPAPGKTPAGAGAAGTRQAALDDFQAAIDLDPECWLALHNRAVSYAQQQRAHEALQDFNRVIALNPGLAVAYRNRGELLGSLGRTEEAVRDYTQAIAQLPDDAELYLMRGHAWHRLGQYDRALRDLSRSIELAPDQPDAYTYRGNVHAERGEFREAVADLRHSLAIDPNWADAYRSLSWLLATCPDPGVRDPQQAVRAAQQAAELAPEDCYVLDALAAAYASAGQFSKAVRCQQQALAAAPADLAAPLRQRLELYEQRQPYRNAPASAVQPAAYEDSHQPPGGRQPR